MALVLVLVVAVVVVAVEVVVVEVHLQEVSWVRHYQYFDSSLLSMLVHTLRNKNLHTAFVALHSYTAVP